MGYWKPPFVTMVKGRKYLDCLLVRGYMYRLVWLYHYGKFPPKGFQIDHKNNDKTNDRITNLQQLTARENLLKAVDYRMHRGR